MKQFITSLLFSTLLFSGFSQCSETSKTKILLMGDSWAFFMNVDGTINKVAKDWGHSDVEYYTNLILSENGAETDDFLKPSKVSELAGKLASMPDLKVVHLSIAGNDFLGSWDVSFTPEKIDSLYNGVAGRLDSIIAQINQIRPDVQVFWSGYTYTNFGEVIGSLPSFLQSSHPFYSRWQAMGFPTFTQINTVQNWFQEKIRVRYASNSKVTYIPAASILQYTYGQTANLAVPPSGTYPAFTATIPEGHVDYPSPRNSMRDYLLTKDCFHLSVKGYYDFISYHFQKFYQKHLMEDDYTIADFSKSGSVSNSGTISNELKIGKDGSDEYVGIIHLDNNHLEANVPESLSLFIKIDTVYNTNFLTTGDFELDIIQGNFGGTESLDAQDYFSTSGITGSTCVFGTNEVGKWVRFDLPASFLDHIRKSKSQIRIRYTGTTDGVVKFVNTANDDFQPVLEVKYGASYLGLSNQSSTSKLDIYPNPTKDILNIVSNESIENISIYTVSGQLMLNEVNPSNAINVSTLPVGMYIINVQIGNQIQQQKFIKQ